MNPPTLYGSKVDEDPQEFLDLFYKVLYAIGMTSSEKVELASYKLKDVTQTLYLYLRDNSLLMGGMVTWEVFKVAFLDWFSPREMR